jgi:hypothetical protein
MKESEKLRKNEIMGNRGNKELGSNAGGIQVFHYLFIYISFLPSRTIRDRQLN